MSDNKKYYWLKLQRDFFKRHDVKIIEAMENGKDYIIFYLKLLTESIPHEGALRFSDTIPYDEKMLATITNTNIDIVRSAIRLFQQLHLMELWDDQTVFMTETAKMLGSETKYAEIQRNYRKKRAEISKIEEKTSKSVKLLDNVITKKDNVEQEIDIELEIELDIYNNTARKTSDVEVLFDTFWSKYPKKVGKDKCKRWFNARKTKITTEFVDDLILAIENQKKSKQWLKENGQFIPHPYTWLNRGGWNDELGYRPENEIKNRWEGFLTND